MPDDSAYFAAQTMMDDKRRPAGRIGVIDDLRGLCIISVAASHAVMLFAPRVAYLRCDALGPHFIDCGEANLAALFVANVQAVVVFAFLSGLTVPRRTGARIGRRGVRLAVVSLIGAILTFALFSVDAVEGDRMARLASALPFANPAERYWLADPGWTDLGRLALGIEYASLVAGRIDQVSGAWPPLWCVPWFILGWLALAFARTLPGPWSAIVLACAATASIAIADQGIMAAIVAGYLARPWLGRVPSAAAAVALVAGLALALLPEARVMPSDWLTWSPPSLLVSLWQALAAALIATGYLTLARSSVMPGLAWFGRNSLWIFAFHWPVLLMVGTAWILAGAPWAMLAVAALVLVALPYGIALLALVPTGHKRLRSGARLPDRSATVPRSGRA